MRTLLGDAGEMGETGELGGTGDVGGNEEDGGLELERDRERFSLPKAAATGAGLWEYRAAS
jgi:hypothetical protein